MEYTRIARGSSFSTSRFTAQVDAPDFVVAPLAKGEAAEVRVFVYYTLRDGLISSIRVARAGELRKVDA